MSKRKQGQKKGYLGHRSHGRGNVKNRRGSGNRGGRGMSGIDKHKWSWAMVYDKRHFDKHGFVPPTKKEVKVAHLYDEENKAEKKGSGYVFEFDGKILATGQIRKPVEIKAASWSKNVEAKLKKVGGSISKLEGSGPKPVTAPKPAAKVATPKSAPAAPKADKT